VSWSSGHNYKSRTMYGRSSRTALDSANMARTERTHPMRIQNDSTTVKTKQKNQLQVQRTCESRTCIKNRSKSATSRERFDHDVVHLLGRGYSVK